MAPEDLSWVGGDPNSRPEGQTSTIPGPARSPCPRHKALILQTDSVHSCPHLGLCPCWALCLEDLVLFTAIPTCWTLIFSYPSPMREPTDKLPTP